MKIHGKVFLLAAVIVLAMGCAGTTVKETGGASAQDPVMETQKKNIEQLNNLIAGITERIAELKSTPNSPDPIVEEIRQTDLAGMKLRKKQLVFLLNHCQYTVKILDQHKQNPREEQQAQEKWEAHRQQLLSGLDAFDKKEDALERKRIQLEMQLIESSLHR